MRKALYRFAAQRIAAAADDWRATHGSGAHLDDRTRQKQREDLVLQVLEIFKEIDALPPRD